VKVFLLAAAFAAAFAGCVTAPQVVKDCSATIALDVLSDVDKHLDVSEVALEDDAVRYGVDAVLCALRHLVDGTMLTCPPDRDRQEHRHRVAREFRDKH